MLTIDARIDNVDMSSPDLAREPGCASGITGTPIGTAFACPGTFGIGQAGQACASGWSVCTESTGVDQPACHALSGFFMANLPGYWAAIPENVACNQMNASNREWFGCGGTRTGVVAPITPCQGFERSLVCGTASSWDCSAGHTLAQTVNNNATDGVLCCKP